MKSISLWNSGSGVVVKEELEMLDPSFAPVRFQVLMRTGQYLTPFQVYPSVPPAPLLQ